ncbi:AAA family ATPase [Deltaproteobacteria bacterium TL4]
MKVKSSIGLSDFKELIQKHYYYVDKSLMIQELLEKGSKIILLPRPRRFGKTLNLSMLRYFFEKTEDSNAPLFHGLAVEQIPEIMEHQGKYPVLFLTFKDIKENSWENCFAAIQRLIADLYKQHKPFLYEALDSDERPLFDEIIKQTSNPSSLEAGLKFLMNVMKRVYQKNVIVLIDEYDVPIHAGYQHEYYDRVVLLIRNLLSAAFKDNSDLEKGVLTGILKIAKESIFSGLNNLDVYTILSTGFSTRFGFTQNEVTQIFKDFELSDQQEQAQAWYNGYLFGKEVMYNPWSVLNFVDKSIDGFRPYWINTGSNEMLRELMLEKNQSLKPQIEQLLNGGTISTPLDENIVLRDMDKSALSVWSLLVFSGYLKPVKVQRQGYRDIYDLAIPNAEVRLFFEDSVQQWLSFQVGDQRLAQLLKSLVEEDIETFGDVLQDIVLSVLSFHDSAGNEPERVYHTFVLGLLVHLSNRYIIHSNHESGYGRYDMTMTPRDSSQTGFIFEFKKIHAKKENTHELAMQSAFKQIQEKKYATELRNAGVQKVLGIGVVVEGKQLWVASLEL